ncbi:hypothetical protein CPC08DRAFT_820169 [Agrocybe pediades]|nr:hypothetical protein CPC08DRAFT_820169 [Agrocybe pediades]
MNPNYQDYSTYGPPMPRYTTSTDSHPYTPPVISTQSPTPPPLHHPHVDDTHYVYNHLPSVYANIHESSSRGKFQEGSSRDGLRARTQWLELPSRFPETDARDDYRSQESMHATCSGQSNTHATPLSSNDLAHQPPVSSQRLSLAFLLNPEPEPDARTARTSTSDSDVDVDQQYQQVPPPPLAEQGSDYDASNHTSGSSEDDASVASVEDEDTVDSTCSTTAVAAVNVDDDSFNKYALIGGYGEQDEVDELKKQLNIVDVPARALVSSLLRLQQKDQSLGSQSKPLTVYGGSYISRTASNPSELWRKWRASKRPIHPSVQPQVQRSNHQSSTLIPPLLPERYLTQALATPSNNGSRPHLDEQRRDEQSLPGSSQSQGKRAVRFIEQAIPSSDPVAGPSRSKRRRVEDNDATQPSSSRDTAPPEPQAVKTPRARQPAKKTSKKAKKQDGAEEPPAQPRSRRAAQNATPGPSTAPAETQQVQVQVESVQEHGHVQAAAEWMTGEEYGIALPAAWSGGHVYEALPATDAQALICLNSSRQNK